MLQIRTASVLQRDLESMQAAVKLSQEKVSEYWKKVQTSENLLMEQVRDQPPPSQK